VVSSGEEMEGAVYRLGFPVVIKPVDSHHGKGATIDIPLTYSGKAAFQIQNVLAACLAAFVQEVKIEDLRAGLQTFFPSSAQLPGRIEAMPAKIKALKELEVDLTITRADIANTRLHSENRA